MAFIAFSEELHGRRRGKFGSAILQQIGVVSKVVLMLLICMIAFGH
jgi:hypothetical protein